MLTKLAICSSTKQLEIWYMTAPLIWNRISFNSSTRLRSELSFCIGLLSLRAEKVKSEYLLSIRNITISVDYLCKYVNIYELCRKRKNRTTYQLKIWQTNDLMLQLVLLSLLSSKVVWSCMSTGNIK